ncbi:MAG: PQQ-dependent sugar dehydrogenase [Verrucomicrobiota bacterium]
MKAPCCLFCILVGCLATLRGEIIGTDDFSYSDGSISGEIGGVFWDWNWVTSTHTGVASDWDIDFGGVNVDSGLLETNDSGASREFNGASEAEGAVRASGAVFFQFEMTRSGSATWGGASAYDFGNERIFFGVPGSVAFSDTVGIEVHGGNPNPGVTTGSIDLTDDQDYGLIAVLDYDNDLLGLFVDADASDFWDASGGTADVTRTFTGSNWTTAVRLGSGGLVEWDDLRVATEWSDLAFANNDTDNNGMDDTWETQNGLIVGINDSGLDPDMDGLTNVQEFENMTNPQVGDSDGDTVDDGTEVLAGTDPNDASSFPGQDVSGQLVGFDGFDYANGPIDALGGGLFWDFDNNDQVDPFLGHTGTTSDWDAGAGSPQVIGGKLVTQGADARRQYNGPTEGENGQTDERSGAFGGSGFGGFESNVIYYKFEMTRSAGTTWSGGSSLDWTTERYLFGVPGTPNPVSGEREFAIHNLNTNDHSYSGIQPVDGQTYIVVAKLDWSNDIAALYIDPDLTLSESRNTPVATYNHTSSNWSSAIRLGSGGSGSTEWDNVKVTTDWLALGDFAPVVWDDTVAMHPGGKARIPVLANDSGLLDLASVTVVAPPVSGNATASADGTILYENTSGLPGVDTFSYSVSEATGNFSSTATVTVELTTDFRFDANFINVPPDPPATALVVEPAFPGITFDSPHGFCSVPGDTQKLFITEGDGRIMMIPDVTAPTKLSVLDITDRVNHDDNELAMKGIDVHPDWATNGYVYVTYNSTADTVRLSRFTGLTVSPFTIDPSSELILIDQHNDGPFHNISVCKFGPEGYLYVGFGDEGTQDDGFDNSQHVDKDLWSCIIRIDVDKDTENLIPNPDSDIPRVAGGSSGEAHFRIPADNPFIDTTVFNGISLTSSEVRTEIFLMGVRNPWGFSVEDNDFDNEVDEVWVADVGRADREDVSIFTAGENGGWAWREGDVAGPRSGQVINGASESAATLVEPIWSYGRGGEFGGSSVIGGHIYRQNALPTLTGKYVFLDFVSGNIWSLDRSTNPVTVERIGGEGGIVGILDDPSSGEILLLDRDGDIKRLTEGSEDNSYPQTLSATNFFADLGDLTPNPGAVFYTPNLRFWSDFGAKKRWFLISNVTDTMGYTQNGPWNYPAGMLWVKHFEYPTQWESFDRTIDGQTFADRRPTTTSPVRRVETRFLLRNGLGAYGVSYRWENLNGSAQGDATLANTNGEDFNIDILLDGTPTQVPWRIPSRTDCLTCHTPQAGHSLSFNTPQLNTQGSIAGVPGNFIEMLDTAGYLSGFSTAPPEWQRHVKPDETQFSLEARVRSYLAVNCAYCHQSGGTGGGNWDGRSELTLAETGMVKGVPVDEPLQPGDLIVTPKDISKSILFNRTAAANGYSRMPPLATNEVDLEGAQLIAEWIAQEVEAYVNYDEWRMAQFGNTTSAEGEPGANPDGDSGDNHFEWLSNTDPNDRDSFWSPRLRLEGGMVNIDFEGLSSRRMTIYRSQDLATWVPWFAPGNDGIPWNPALLHSLTAPMAGERDFFRAEIEER